jgi:hypothetical protein
LQDTRDTPLLNVALVVTSAMLWCAMWLTYKYPMADTHVAPPERFARWRPELLNQGRQINQKLNFDLRTCKEILSVK